MTRGEVIKKLKWFREYNEDDFCGGDRIQDEYGDWYYRITEQDFEAFDMAIKALEQEPKTGHWIFAGEENEEETKSGNFRYVCSECCHSDVHAKTTEVPYCWYCGAKMAETEADNGKID